MERRTWLAGVLVALAVVASVPVAVAQAWPSKPIRIIVPYPPGGGNDSLARLFGQKLSERLGQPVVIENKPGAGTLIGTEAAARAPGDGYTLLLSSITTHALAPHLYAKVPYDPFRDFVPITTLAVAPTVLVINPSIPASSLQEFIQLLRASPGKYSYASGGVGTSTHITGAIFAQQTGTNLLHVPFKGGGPALAAIVAGDVNMILDTAASGMPHVSAGRLRALAIDTPTRHPSFPNLPTFAEQGMPNYSVANWYSLHAPAGTPNEVVQRVYREIVAILEMPDVREKLKAISADPGGMSPEEFERFVRAENKRYGELIRTAGIKAE